MKKLIIASVMILIFTAGCAHAGRYNTQSGALYGAGLGALAGQAIGRNTGATLIGAGAGALLGSLVGNSMDQHADEYRHEKIRDNYRHERFRDNYRREALRDEYRREQLRREYLEREASRLKAERIRNHYDSYDWKYRRNPPGRWVIVPGYWQGHRWIPEHKEWRAINPR